MDAGRLAPVHGATGNDGVDGIMTGRGDFAAWRETIESRLSSLMTFAGETPASLRDSMRHSLLAPGKRLRALLVMACASERTLAPDNAPGHALDSACAVEMVHAASLILDDLPSMDDASLRRGQPANHVVFGESTAILAGIALLSEAFQVVARDPHLSPDARAEAVRVLSNAVGVKGLAAGQFADLERERSHTTCAFETIHAQKTGALFAASAEMGGLIARASTESRIHHAQLGMAIGMAFQAFDDVLDHIGKPAHTGKNVGQDMAQGSLVNRLDVDGATAKIFCHLDEAETHRRAVCADNGPLQGYISHLRGELERHLDLCC